MQRRAGAAGMGTKRSGTALGCHATRSRLHIMTTSASNEPVLGTIASATARWDDFSPLLQRGVFCPLAARCSVQDFLTGQLGIAPAYVRDRIATVFVDGSVVDDLETATLQPGSTPTPVSYT